MSDQHVERVMMLASCSEEDAKKALSKTNDIIDAVDMIMNVPITRGAPKHKTLTEEQIAFMELRKNMEAIDSSVQNNLMMSNQSDSSSQVLKHTHALDQEGMMLHSDCIQSSQIPTQVEEEQKQETVCQ
jgi:Asp-tRNA(Asn)/Glu-tRNA(Gln) amidotransferase C subunit